MIKMKERKITDALIKKIYNKYKDCFDMLEEFDRTGIPHTEEDINNRKKAVKK